MKSFRQLSLFLNVMWAGFIAQVKEIVRYNSYIFSALLFPFLNLSLMVFYFRYSGQEQFLSFAVVGSGLMGIWLAATFITVYILQIERWAATLELLIATPSSLQLWILGRSAASTLLSLVSLAITLMSARFLFGVQLVIQEPMLFLSMVLGVTITLILLGTLISSLFVLTRSAEVIVNALLYPVYLLSGVVFPIVVLPGWLQPFSLLMPLYWASLGLQAAMAGGWETVGESLLILSIMSAIFAWAATWCFRTIEQRVRKDASLALA